MISCAVGSEYCKSECYWRLLEVHIFFLSLANFELYQCSTSISVTINVSFDYIFHSFEVGHLYRWWNFYYCRADVLEAQGLLQPHLVEERRTGRLHRRAYASEVRFLCTITHHWILLVLLCYAYIGPVLLNTLTFQGPKYIPCVLVIPNCICIHLHCRGQIIFGTSMAMINWPRMACPSMGV